MIPLHPQACPGDPQRVCWVTTPDAIPFTGLAGTVPSELDELVKNATVAEIRLEAQAVVIRLGSGHRWSTAGPQVRSALHAALARPDQWAPCPPDRLGSACHGCLRRRR